MDGASRWLDARELPTAPAAASATRPRRKAGCRDGIRMDGLLKGWGSKRRVAPNQIRARSLAGLANRASPSEPLARLNPAEAPLRKTGVGAVARPNPSMPWLI